jgi:hypothetical protein
MIDPETHRAVIQFKFKRLILSSSSLKVSVEPHLFSDHFRIIFGNQAICFGPTISVFCLLLCQ